MVCEELKERVSLLHMYRKKNRPRNIYFMANKLCEKSVQSPELRTLSGRQLSSGEQGGPVELETHTMMDGDHGRAGSQHIRYVQTALPPPAYGGFFSFSSLEFHLLVQTTPDPWRAEGVRKFMLGSPKASREAPKC